MIAALVTGLVAGCSSGQRSAEADVGPTPTRATSPATPSPTVTPGVLDDVARARIPKAARAHTPAGAEAFARFYIEQVNASWTTANSNLLFPYASPSCKTCAKYASTANWLQENDFRYAKPPATIISSIWLPESTHDSVLVRVVHIQEARDIIRRDGSVVKTLERLPGESELSVRWVDADWRISSVRGVEWEK